MKNVVKVDAILFPIQNHGLPSMWYLTGLSARSWSREVFEKGRGKEEDGEGVGEEGAIIIIICLLLKRIEVEGTNSFFPLYLVVGYITP